MIYLSILPTYFFGEGCKARFLRAFNDAGLLQTSVLDEYESSPVEREEYRKWLVDCHKASYVPICMAGGHSMLTAEAAEVLGQQATFEASWEEPQESPREIRKALLLRNVWAKGRSQRALSMSSVGEQAMHV